MHEMMQAYKERRGRGIAFLPDEFCGCVLTDSYESNDKGGNKEERGVEERHFRGVDNGEEYTTF